MLGCVIRKALVLVPVIVSEHAGPDNAVTISGDGKTSVKVALAE